MSTKVSVILAFVIALIGFPLHAQPTYNDIENALQVFFHGRGEVNSFDYKIFENGAGTGRIAIEGTAGYYRDILTRTNEIAFLPGVKSRVKNVIYKSLNIELSRWAFTNGRLHRPVYNSGELVQFSGSIFYEEAISSFDWEFDIDENLPAGTPITELPLSAIIEGSRRYEEISKDVGKVVARLKDAQSIFIEQTLGKILGSQFVHKNQCTGKNRYLLSIDETPHTIMRGSIHNLFSTKVIFTGTIDFSINEERGFIPSIAGGDGKIRIKSRLESKFESSARSFVVRLQRDKVEYSPDGGNENFVETDAVLNLIGTWQHPHFPGFANGNPDRGCVTLVFELV